MTASLLVRLWAILPAWLLISSAGATTYYVDPTDGNDANAGTSEGAAWKTISKVGSASSGFAPGDVIKFRRGTIIGPDGSTGNMVLTTSGTSENPITFTDYTKTGDADGLAKPILDMGNVVVTGWTEQSGNGLPGVYYNNYSGTVFNGFFVNQTYYPHADDIENIQAGYVWWNNASNAGYTGTGGDKTYTKNASYADGIYYKPLPGVDPATATHRKASNNTGVSFTDVNYLTFSNLHFKGGTTCVYGIGVTADLVGIKFIDSEFSQCKFAAMLRTTTGEGFAIRNVLFDTVSVDDCGRGLAMETSDTNGSERVIDSSLIDTTFSNMSAGKWRTYGSSADWESITLQNPVGVVVEGTYCGDSNGMADCVLIWTDQTEGILNSTEVVSSQIYDARNGIIAGATATTPSNGLNLISGNVIYGCDEYGIKLNAGIGLAANNTISECDTSIKSQTGFGGWDVKNNLSLNPATNHMEWGNTATNRPDYNWYYPISGSQFLENVTQYTLTNWKAQLVTNGVANPDANSTAGTDPQVDVLLRPTSDSGLIGAGVNAGRCRTPEKGTCLGTYDIGAYQDQSVPYGYTLKPKKRR